MAEEKQYTLEELREKLKYAHDEVSAIEKSLADRGELNYPKYIEGRKDALRAFYMMLAIENNKEDINLIQ